MELLGFPSTFGGTFTSGGSTANLVGIGAARQHAGERVGLDLSRDGHFAIFYSEASDLVPGDTNSQGDVFVKDLWSGALVRASVSTNGTQANWNSYYPRISADGRCAVFFSMADTLVPGDTNWEGDAFLHDLVLGTTERISLTSAGHEARGTTRFCSVSDDGRWRKNRTR